MFVSVMKVEAYYESRFCPIEMICNIKQMVIKFKQEEDEPLVKTWETFRSIGIGYEITNWLILYLQFLDLTFKRYFISYFL